MKLISGLILIHLALLSNSCDPGVTYERVIENKTTHDIWIKTADNPYLWFTQDSFSIPKNSEQIISVFSGIGQTTQFENCGMLDSSIFGGIIDMNTLEISKDLNAQSNWAFSVLKKTFKQGGECECRLILTDADIE